MAAPLAHFDEDWQDFNDFQSSGTDSVSRLDVLNSNVAEAEDHLSDLEVGFSGERCSFRSVEDLVHDLDDQLALCFLNHRTSTEHTAPIRAITEDSFLTHRTSTEHTAPIRAITEDSFLEHDEVWSVLTGNYGNVMPVNWTTSHTRCLHLPTLNLRTQVILPPADQSDDEELREQMDMHSVIVSSCSLAEPLPYTADQVIEEIEEMMQESPDPEVEDTPSQTRLSLLGPHLSCPGPNPGPNPGPSSLEARLRGLTVAALTEALEEVELSIRRHSNELIAALALRDEREEEKEVKNRFISLLIELQNVQKEQRKHRRLRPAPASAAQRHTHTPGTYLTTVIPYEKKTGSPSVEQLLILSKILRAMKDDSETVPGLLTDYILKVLCPT